MHKKIINLFGLLFLLGSVFSCSNETINDSKLNLKNPISSNIHSMSQKGLFDSLLGNINSRSISELTEDEILIKRFITETDTVLEEIKTSEYGDIEYNFVNALFNKGSINEVYKAFEYDSIELAEDFENKTKSIFDVDGLSKDQVIINYLDSPNTSRMLFDSDFETDTILCYAGVCAAMTAGCIAGGSWKPWIRIAGYVAASASAAAIVCQLICWGTNDDFVKLIKDCSNKDYDKIILDLNSNNLLSGLCWVITITTGTLVACAFTSTGKLVITSVQSKWNEFSKIIKEIIDILKQSKKKSAEITKLISILS